MAIKAFRIKENDDVNIIGVKEPWWYKVKTSSGQVVVEHASNLVAKGWILGAKPKRVK